MTPIKRFIKDTGILISFIIWPTLSLIWYCYCRSRKDKDSQKFIVYASFGLAVIFVSVVINIKLGTILQATGLTVSLVIVLTLCILWGAGAYFQGRFIVRKKTTQLNDTWVVEIE